MTYLSDIMVGHLNQAISMLLRDDVTDEELLKYMQVLLNTCRFYNYQLSEKAVQEAISQFRLGRQERKSDIEFQLRVALGYAKSHR